MTDEHDLDDTTSTALDLRRPDVPVDLNELAARKAEAHEIMEARGQVLATARKIMIAATFPTDYVLFKSPTGQITAYLQDHGADRVRDILGIEVFDVSRPERIATNDPAVFHYIVSGSGRSKVTGQTIENVEGGRSSTDDVCKGKTGAELELLVRKSARANLDGSITRELAGLKSVPISELEEVWKNQPRKKIADCPLGRGFGSRDERFGAAPANAPDVDPPICPHCKSKGVYRPAKDNRRAFYGCPKYSTHPDKKFIIDAEKWIADHPAKLTPAQAAGFTGADTRPPSTSDAVSRPSTTTPPSADEIFGNANARTREPGEDDE